MRFSELKCAVKHWNSCWVFVAFCAPTAVPFLRA